MQDIGTSVEHIKNCILVKRLLKFVSAFNNLMRRFCQDFLKVDPQKFFCPDLSEDIEDLRALVKAFVADNVKLLKIIKMYISLPILMLPKPQDIIYKIMRQIIKTYTKFYTKYVWVE